MKSFSIGVAAALIAAYSIAEEPSKDASTPYMHATVAASPVAANESGSGGVRKTSRGLPTFWGHSGLVRF